MRVEPDGSVYRSQAPCIRIPKSRLGSVLEGFDFYQDIMKCPVPIGCNCMSKLYSGSEYPAYITRDCLKKFVRPDLAEEHPKGAWRVLRKLKDILN